MPSTVITISIDPAIRWQYWTNVVTASLVYNTTATCSDPCFTSVAEAMDGTTDSRPQAEVSFYAHTLFYTTIQFIFKLTAHNQINESVVTC